MFRKHARRTLGCQRVGKTLAFYGVKARYRGIEIETVILGVAGDNSRSTAGNFDDIGVGHVSFLLLALSEHAKFRPCKPLALPVRRAPPANSTHVNAGMTRSAGATVSFKRNLRKIV